MNLTKIDDSCVVHFCCISIGRSGLGVRKKGKEKKRNQSTGHDCVPRSTGDAEDVPLTNSSWGRRRGAWQVQLGWRTKSGPWASKQTQPLSKARPELRSPAHSLLLPLDGERRWPSFARCEPNLHERIRSLVQRKIWEIPMAESAQASRRCPKERRTTHSGPCAANRRRTRQ